MPTRIDLVEDVLPISELRLRAAQQISKIQETQRPLVITQYGKAVAVLMEVAQFQTWQDRLTDLEELTSRLEKRIAELTPPPAAVRPTFPSPDSPAAPRADSDNRDGDSS